MVAKRDIDSGLERQNKYWPSIYVNAPRPAPFDFAPTETPITHPELNACIILGGATQNTPEIVKGTYNSTITLVSGMATAIKNQPPPTNPNGKISLSGHFYYDSAVLQISEQTNVDANFGARIKDKKAENASAIALKADEVRLFSRGSVKIITGMDQRDKLIPDKDAPSHPKRDFSGIHLIANNAVETESQLHPLVLGRNLQEFLNEILNEITSLYSLIGLITECQVGINKTIKDHVHFDVFTQQPTIRGCDPELNMKCVEGNEILMKLTAIDTNTKSIPNIENLRKNYLTKNANKYINSYFNKTN